MPVSLFRYSIKNEAADSVDIFIDGDIVDASTQHMIKEFWGDDTTTSFKSFRDQISNTQAKTLNVFINSGGGVVTDAMAIHDLLTEMQRAGKTVNTIGRGIIASAATYILMAGNNSRMSKNSWFMIHNVSGAVWGDVNMVESYAGTLRKFNDHTRDFYANATGMRKEDITKMMNAETWMTADEAKAKGFIKQVEGETEFTNAIPKDHWQFSNMAVLNSYNAAVKQAKDENSSTQNFDEMKTFFQELGEKIMNAIKGIKQPENNDHSVLMQSIGEAVNNSFSAAAEQIQEAINEAVAEQVKNKTASITMEFDASKVASVVEETLKPFAEQMEALETENEELKKDITNLKAGKSTSKETGKEQSGYQMKGKFGSFADEAA